jgi:hypothetical protein
MHFKDPPDAEDAIYGINDYDFVVSASCGALYMAGGRWGESG